MAHVWKIENMPIRRIFFFPNLMPLFLLFFLVRSSNLSRSYATILRNGHNCGYSFAGMLSYWSHWSVNDQFYVIQRKIVICLYVCMRVFVHDLFLFAYKKTSRWNNVYNLKSLSQIAWNILGPFYPDVLKTIPDKNHGFMPLLILMLLELVYR